MRSLQRYRARPNPRRDHALGKPSTFFIGPVDDTDWVCRFDPVIVQSLDHLKASTNAKNAIVSSALTCQISYLRLDTTHCRLCIQMTTCVCRMTRFPTWPHRELIPHGVCSYCAVEILSSLCEPVPCLLITVTQRQPCHASLSWPPWSILAPCCPICRQTNSHAPSLTFAKFTGLMNGLHKPVRIDAD